MYTTWVPSQCRSSAPSGFLGRAAPSDTPAPLHPQPAAASPCSGAGSTATWSLSRLDALAAEAAALFRRECQQGEAEEVPSAAAAAAFAAADGTLPTLPTLRPDLARRFPVTLLGAVNAILFDRHGYRRMPRHGDPAASTLSAVLGGRAAGGSPAAMAVLYSEVCARLGLDLASAPLEGGRYFVLWPRDPRVALGAGGQRLVVDPYSGGDLQSVEEVRAPPGDVFWSFVRHRHCFTSPLPPPLGDGGRGVLRVIARAAAAAGAGCRRWAGGRAGGQAAWS